MFYFCVIEGGSQFHLKHSEWFLKSQVLHYIFLMKEGLRDLDYITAASKTLLIL